MNNIIDRDLVRQATVETRIHPAFVEKDWYGMQLLQVLSKFKNDNGVELIFSGGTSLSKGWHLVILLIWVGAYN